MPLASWLKQNLAFWPFGSAIAQKYLLVAQLALRLAMFTCEGVVNSPIFRRRSMGRSAISGTPVRATTRLGVFVGKVAFFFACRSAAREATFSWTR
jgi:hypothetical protein